MQVQWNSLLQQLGTKCSDEIDKDHICPLHPTGRERTLQVYLHPATGCYHYHCIHSKCQFTGDAVQLLAKVKGLSIEDAAYAFATPPYADCLDDILLETQIQDYLDDRTGQAGLRDYLMRCTERLFKGPHSYTIRRRLLNIGVTEYARSLPADLGAVDPDNPPSALAHLGKPGFRNGHFLLFPYSYEGRITAVATQQLDSTGELGQFKLHALKDCSLGVFPESHLDAVQKRLLVCESAIGACKLTKVWRYARQATAPVIHALGFPLPRACNDRTILLVDMPEHPLSLKFALQAYTAEAVVLGRTDTEVRVIPNSWVMKQRSIQDAAVNNSKSVPLIDWILQQMIHRGENEESDHVLDALQSVPLTDAQRDKLLEHLADEDAPACIIQIVSDSHLFSRGELRLANGMRIAKRIDGMFAYASKNADTLLTNTLIRVDGRIITAKQDVIYDCSFKHKDAGVVRGRLTSEDISSADRLQKAMSYAYLTNTSSATYIACYDAGKNYKWRDILNKLAEGAPTYKETTKLGVDEDLRIQLPNLELDVAQNMIRPQERIFTLAPAVLDCYSGLIPIQDNGQALERTREMLRNCDNMYVGGFMLGVCQVIFTLLHARQSMLRGSTMPRAHLCYAEPVPGIWAATFNNLHMLFSNNPDAAHIDTNAKQHLAGVIELGELPYIAYLPPWSSRQVSNLFHDSPVNLITRVDGGTASLLSHEATLNFVLPPHYKAADANTLHPEDVLAFQQALPGLIRYVFKEDMGAKLMPGVLARTVRPAHGVYQMLCELLDVETSETINSMLDEYYTAMDLGSLQAFCAGLNKVLYVDAEFKHENPHGADIVSGTPTARELNAKNPPVVFMTREVAYLHKRSVNLVARVTHDPAFNLAALTAELREQDYLAECPDNVDIDLNSYWTVKRKVWDRCIKQERLVLVDQVVPGEIIHLDRFIA